MEAQKKSKKNQKNPTPQSVVSSAASLVCSIYSGYKLDKFKGEKKPTTKQTTQTLHVHFKDLYSSVFFHATIRPGSINNTLRSWLLWCPVRPAHTNTLPTPGSSELILAIQRYVNRFLESWACRLQTRKIDYFDHNSCICMNEFLIVATTVKSESTKQSKVMD